MSMALAQAPFESSGLVSGRIPVGIDPAGLDLKSNAIEALVVEVGHATLMIGDKAFSVGPSALLAFWGACPHRVVSASPNAVLVRVSIPLVEFTTWVLPAHLSKTFLNGGVLSVARGSEVFGGQNAFALWERDLGSDDPHLRKAAALGVEAMFYRLASRCHANGPARDRAGSARNPTSVKQYHKVGRIANFVANHYRQPIRVSEIARSVGMSASAASRLFKEACGVNLIQFLNQHRVSYARNLLANTRLGIEEIVDASGYRSASRFYAVHRKLFGQSPMEYRASTMHRN